MLEQYCHFARMEWTQEKKPEGRTLEIVRKIGGIAVNCMEHHGAPMRDVSTAVNRRDGQ